MTAAYDWRDGLDAEQAARIDRMLVKHRQRQEVSACRAEEQAATQKHADTEQQAAHAAKIKAAMASTPALRAFIRDAFDAGIISGLRDVTLDADAAWRALPGYIHHPAMPPRKTSTPNASTACRWSHQCAYDTCPASCRLLNKS